MKKAPLSFFVLALALWGAAAGFGADAKSAASAAPRLGAGTPGAPVVLPGARQYDFVSQLNGRPYRLMIWAPADAGPNKAYPVVYLLDGNEYFAAAATDSWHYENAIIVGLSYITDSVNEGRERRTFELTPTADPIGAKSPSGGGDAFVRVLLEEIKPFVETRYRVEPGRRGLFGVSLGGLTVLNVLFHHPEAFDAYIAGSPAIWWKDRDVLKGEQAFSDRVRAGELKLKVLITSAGNEQYRGQDPALLAQAAKNRMIDNAAELAERLRGLRPQAVPVVFTIFPDESHGSGSYAALRRGLAFVLATPPK